MTSAHAAGVPAVHQAGIDEGDATFGTAAPGWAAFDAAELPGYRFVALGADGSVLGWTAVSPVSARTGDAGAVEHPVSVRPDARGRGLAGTLVHEISRFGFADLDAQTLVMVADPEYLAIRVYRSVGFADTEVQIGTERKPEE